MVCKYSYVKNQIVCYMVKLLCICTHIQNFLVMCILTNLNFQNIIPTSCYSDVLNLKKNRVAGLLFTSNSDQILG